MALYKIIPSIVAALALGSGVGGSIHANDTCSPAFLSSTLAIPNNGSVLDLSAYDSSQSVTGSAGVLNFCNVTITYTHPGWNDTININVLLPQTNWNGRFQGVGGGGWAASSGSSSLLAAVAQNYSAGNTDAGHANNGGSSASWAFKGNGELNIPLLQDFASTAYNDLAVVGKQLANKYYGYGPNYSYWSGCSTGGRQGLMMAQRYPTAYDGIYAGSPAIHWESFQIAQYWGQFVMNQLDHHPPNCVFDYITAAAVSACDALDGVVDGVISALNRCHFDPYSVVGQVVNCTDGTVTISSQDAEIAQKTWQGPRASNGTFLWWGINPGTQFEGLTGTTCSSLTNCTGSPVSISTDWISNWVLDDPQFDFESLTLETFTRLFPEAYRQYHEIIGTEDPDLQGFRNAGGKMVTWHGLADQLIYPNGTISYYEAVESRDPKVRDYYRFFPAPGVAHCGGGAGEAPVDPLDAVTDWVESGKAPDTLAAKSADGLRTRNLCQYPLFSVYEGGDPADSSSFACRESW
ncbi:MAG: hypothetical protein M1820_000741 [Bogoriella megaspora]|nr:MAG: hypothetical protein M1820_000741 [Bogoriella megaspora]